MKITNLRASTLNQFKDCEWKYFLNYVVGLQEPSNKKASLGTCGHLVCEILAKTKKTGHYKLEKCKYNNYKYLLDLCFQRCIDENPHHQYYQEDYDFCQSSIEKILASDYNPLKLNILYTEKQFELTIARDGFETPDGNLYDLRGTIDLITQPDEETYHIVDWKFGKRLLWSTGEAKELEHFYEDIQFMIYDLAIQTLYPHIKHRIFTVYFPNDGGPFTFSYDGDTKEKTLAILKEYFDKISQAEKPSRLKDLGYRSSEFFKCKYVCYYGAKYSNTCDKYHKILKDNKGDLEKTSSDLIQLTVGKSNDASRRNDYGRAGIERGIIL